MALKRRATDTRAVEARLRFVPRRVGGPLAFSVEALGRDLRWSRPQAQIPVVVACIQMRTLKTEVEKGSM